MVSGFEKCSRLEQFDKFEMFSYWLAKNDKNFIENATDCLFPCTYLEYKIASKDVVNMPGVNGIAVPYGSLAVIVKREVASDSQYNMCGNLKYWIRR